jgi:hypothetical protein
MEFDELNEHPICKKYVPARNSRVGTGNRGGKQSKQPRLTDIIVDGQFRFHPDTENLRKNIHKIRPDSFISISDKWHGTSAVIGRLLTKRPLRWWETALSWLGVHHQTEDYQLMWSSRKVVKGVGESHRDDRSFYAEDIWGTVAKEIGDLIPKGITLYGEIVGYTNEGSPIQSLGGLPYSYGCQPGTHRFVVYRVTYTNPDGKVLEFSWNQISEFCAKYGLEMVRTLWAGYAADFGDNDLACLAGTDEDEWRREFLAQLESTFVNNQDCPECANGLPAEGIVLKVDRLEEDEAYKLKNFRFLEKESQALDAGEMDVETAESETGDEVDVASDAQ